MDIEDVHESENIGLKRIIDVLNGVSDIALKFPLLRGFPLL